MLGSQQGRSIQPGFRGLQHVLHAIRAVPSPFRAQESCRNPACPAQGHQAAPGLQSALPACAPATASGCSRQLSTPWAARTAPWGSARLLWESAHRATWFRQRAADARAHANCECSSLCSSAAGVASTQAGCRLGAISTWQGCCAELSQAEPCRHLTRCSTRHGSRLHPQDATTGLQLSLQLEPSAECGISHSQGLTMLVKLQVLAATRPVPGPCLAVELPEGVLPLRWRC